MLISGAWDSGRGRQAGRAEMIQSAEQLAETVEVVETCHALDIPRSSLRGYNGRSERKVPLCYGQLL